MSDVCSSGSSFRSSSPSSFFFFLALLVPHLDATIQPPPKTTNATAVLRGTPMEIIPRSGLESYEETTLFYEQLANLSKNTLRKKIAVVFCPI